MPTVKIILDKRRAKKDGSFPLVIRIRHDNNYFDISTCYSLKSNQFNEDKQSIIGNKSGTLEIQKMRDTYTGKLTQLMSQKEIIRISDIKAFFCKKKDTEYTFESFWKEEVQKMIDSGRAGNARVYLFTYERLAQLIDFKRPIREISYADILKAVHELLKSGVSNNTVGVYMRTIRAVCNKAINLDLAVQAWYPFHKITIKKDKTVPRVASLQEMQRFFALKINSADPLFRSYCIGKLIFLLRGINLRDLLMLTSSNIISDRIVYKRSKTNKLYSIKILPQVKEILNSLNIGGKTLLGVLDSDYDSIKSDISSVDRYVQVRKVINAHLKRISSLLEGETQLTTYVFRYSWANIAKQLGFSKDMISEALGHEYGNTVTGIYLECFDLEELDRMNEKICYEVKKEG